jgi:cyclin A
MNREDPKSTAFGRPALGVLTVRDENTAMSRDPKSMGLQTQNQAMGGKPRAFGTSMAGNSEAAPRQALAAIDVTSRNNQLKTNKGLIKTKALTNLRASLVQEKQQQPQNCRKRQVVSTSRVDDFSIFCDEESVENVDDELLAHEEVRCFHEEISRLEEKRQEVFEDSQADDRRDADGSRSVMIVDTTCSLDTSLKSHGDLEESEPDVFDDHLFAQCKEYSPEIYLYLLNYERKYSADPQYMSKQPEVNSKMRNILIDWMVEVADEYKLHDETLFLAVHFIDRFLSAMSVSRQSFQLLGTSALFISSKYEEIYPPDINEFVYITDDSYTKKQVLNMERMVLKVLQFDISSPSIHYFLKKFLTELCLPDYVEHMAQYLCYLTLVDGETFLQFYPSEIAVGAILLAAHSFALQHLISSDFTRDTLEMEIQVSGDAEEVICSRRGACLAAIHASHLNAGSHPQQAIYTKFSSSKYQTVALVKPPSECLQI